MKIYKNILLVSLLLSWSYAQTQLQPHNEPLIWEKPPKANILMLLDDSASMKTDDMPNKESRALVLKSVTSDLVTQYRDLANLGLSGLGYNSPTSKSFWTVGARRPLDMAISDIGKGPSLSEKNFKNADFLTGQLKSDGNTPLAFALYEATKYFRGLKIFSALNKADTIFDEKHHPVQYRCQQNHIIMLSDSGGSNQETLYGLVSEDTTGGTVQLNQDSKIDSIAKKMWEDIDLRDYPPTTPQFAESLAIEDLAGKPWKDVNDPGSKRLPIYLHGIFFGATAQGGAYDAMKNAISYSGGELSEAKDTASLTRGFHKIFRTISGSKSGGFIVRNQNVDNNNTFQYRTTYDSSDWTGKLIAERYVSGGNFVAAWDTDEKNPSGNVTIGQFYTLDGNTQVELTTNNLNKIPGITPVTDDQVAWLKGEKREKLRPRSRVIADSINSKLYHIGKYEEFMNTGFLKAEEKEKYDKFYAAKLQSAKDTVIFGSNDGLINFFTAGKSGGDRKYAYFPSFFATHMDEITKQGYIHNYKADGPMSFFDLRTTDKIKTVGIAGMGAGYNGIAAFEIFSTTADGTAPSNDFKALYEITSKSSGFNNLGYTYSQFGFFMGYKSGLYKPTAIFGNGYGSENNVSSLFLINADDGSFQNEILLSNQGGTINGASSPAVVAAKDTSSGFHKLQRIYVGDYAGRLYRVTFDANGNETVTLLFEDPYKNPITTKPVVTYRDGAYWISFGTGSMIDVNLDKGKNSKKMHTFYGIKDDGSITQQTRPIQLSNLLKQELTKSGSSIHLSNHLMMPLHKGWYIPLTAFGNASGERIVDDPVIFLNKYVHFATMGINEGDPDDPCLGDRMFGALVFAGIDTGGASDKPFMDTNGDGKVGGGDAVGAMGIAFDNTATGVLTGEGFTNGDSASGNAPTGIGADIINKDIIPAIAAHKDGEYTSTIFLKNDHKIPPTGRIFFERKF